MKKTLKKYIVPFFFLSLAMNAILIFLYFSESKKEKDELGYAVNQVILNINETAHNLNNLDKNHPDYKNVLIAAQRNFAENRGWINAHITEMPQNLASWNGGMEVGLGNGIYDVDAEVAKETIEDIKNFGKGYDNERRQVNSVNEPYEALKIVENVISSKKYMGDNFIYK
ncbi:hypothetical protein WAK64_08790 [Bacillus spongiae]|uniref:Uncharacterized protein n=1 Tax=Bacillus spongiae TaxID=2683610 RepID=A0ABU8HD85_9BACI